MNYFLCDIQVIFEDFLIRLSKSSYVQASSMIDIDRTSQTRTRRMLPVSPTLLAVILVRTSPQRRPGNGVARKARVQVEQDTRVSAGVQTSTGRSRGQRDSPRAADDDIETLRVVLGAVVGAGAVQRDDLVPDHVVAGLELGRDRQRRRVVARRQRVRRPRPRAVPGLGDLGPRQGPGRRRRAGACCLEGVRVMSTKGCDEGENVPLHCAM